MADRGESPPSRTTDRSRDRLGPGQRLIDFWSEWRFELVVVLVILVGLFLLLEQVQLRELAADWWAAGLEGLKTAGSGFLRRVGNFLQRLTFSDLIGGALLIAALVLLYLRGRWRLMTMERFTARVCPGCGGRLHRVHRRPIDRLVNVIVPVVRYRCRNPECRWRGLRVKRARYE